MLTILFSPAPDSVLGEGFKESSRNDTSKRLTRGVCWLKSIAPLKNSRRTSSRALSMSRKSEKVKKVREGQESPRRSRKSEKVKKVQESQNSATTSN